MKEDSEALELLAKESGPDAKPVTKAEGDTLAREIGAYGYYETSAKTAEGVKDVMDAAIEAINWSVKERYSRASSARTSCSSC